MSFRGNQLCVEWSIWDSLEFAVACCVRFSIRLELATDTLVLECCTCIGVYLRLGLFFGSLAHIVASRETCPSCWWN